MRLRSLFGRVPWWGYGVVGVCYLLVLAVRLFEGPSLSAPGLVVRLLLGWWLVIVGYLNYYGHV